MSSRRFAQHKLQGFPGAIMSVERELMSDLAVSKDRYDAIEHIIESNASIFVVWALRGVFMSKLALHVQGHAGMVWM